MKAKNIFYYITALLLLSGSLLQAGIGIIDIAEPMVITNRGHYCLSRNISVFSGNALDIQASDVTIDLNGYTVETYLGGSDPTPIYQQDGFSRLIVKNGTLSGSQGHGIYAKGDSTTVDSVTVYGCANDAVVVGDYAIIENCIIYSNITSYSSAVIFAGSSATIRNCNLLWNEGSSITLILAGSGALIDGVILASNSAKTTSLNGISVGTGSSVRNCILQNNIASSGMTMVDADTGAEVRSCVISKNNTTASTFTGINLPYGGKIETCSIHNNGTSTGATLYGCRVNGPATVFATTAVSNLSSSAAGYGIHVGTSVVVRACTVYDQNYAGFYGGYISSFKYCLASGNGYQGFHLYKNCVAMNCLSYYNGLLAPFGEEGGFVTINNGNRVIDNHSVRNWKGIVVNGTDNLIKGNSLQNQTLNMEVNNSDNTTGKLIPHGDLGEDFTTDNPFANFGL